MIYTDRKYLSILTLTEDRDYVTYDELIPVLEERPSNTVYIEQDGILCGLITYGDIYRSRDEKIRRVPVNKEYTYVHLGEHMRVRQIFKDRANINALPVVSGDGRLLGDYVRWNDLICTDYAELLWKDPYVLQELKARIQDAVFVEPVVYGGAFRERMFSWWRQKFEREGIHLQVIQHWEIKNYLDTADCFLFADEDEKRGIEILNLSLYGNETAADRSFLTATDYLCRMKRLADILFLKELRQQGVFVLTLDFKENDSQFLAVLRERIRKRNKEHNVHSAIIPEELKESFFGELYCEAYKTQLFPLPIACYIKDGIRYWRDAEAEFWHVRNGERLTVNQPEQYNRCVYLYGPCNITGLYVSDQYTISSLLQSEMNQAGFFCKVVNNGFPGNAESGYLNTERMQRMQSELFRKGDIIVLDQSGLTLSGDFPLLNLTDVLEKHDAPADWFIDSPRHCNHKANQLYAHAIYEKLLPVLQQPPGERPLVELDRDYVKRLYLRHYFSELDSASHGTVGAVSMNCNPFTLGHRFLIEEALKTVDFLIVFVGEEDASVFSFRERFAMVYQGTSDLERVMVVPSGPYFASRRIFPEYFLRIIDENLGKNVENNVRSFAEKIALKLGITYRFMGEEREDKITHEYNEAMKRILPSYGIQAVEIPRKAASQSAISAKRVRQYISENRLEELDELVPASTKRILFCENK